MVVFAISDYYYPLENVKKSKNDLEAQAR